MHQLINLNKFQPYTLIVISSVQVTRMVCLVDQGLHAM